MKVFKITDEIYPTLVVAMVILFVPTILYDILQNYPATFASDGDIWKIKAYNQEGEEACSFAGSLDIKKVCEIENYL